MLTCECGKEENRKKATWGLTGRGLHMNSQEEGYIGIHRQVREYDSDIIEHIMHMYKISKRNISNLKRK